MRVSVVLCTYAPDMYEEFVEAAESLYAQTHPDLEVVIVVDGSQAVYDRVRADFGDRAQTIIHCNDDNLGLLRSRNVGVDLASGDIVAFIDDDAVAHADWVEELLIPYRAQDALAVGGKMVPRWVAGKPAFLPEEFYWLVGVTQRGFADGEGEVRNTFGSNISFRRDIYRDLGGFDPGMGGRKGEANLQGGETELCVRLRKTHDRGVWYRPQAVVEHKVFAYRTRPRWLLNRAFLQGYSKRAMESVLADTGGTESDFLRQLLFEFGPDRLGSLVRRPTLRKVEQFAMLWVLTTTVGLGYLYGILRRAGKKAPPRTDQRP